MCKESSAVEENISGTLSNDSVVLRKQDAPLFHQTLLVFAMI
jgi:hypothetical protein